jgi:hypothetical protein
MKYDCRSDVRTAHATVAEKRLELMAQVLERYPQELEAAAIITVRGGKIRISKSVET